MVKWHGLSLGGSELDDTDDTLEGSGSLHAMQARRRSETSWVVYGYEHGRTGQDY